ncbi:MAG: hypothetical protein LBV19_06515 [Streptococcaceae bacterium]|jgi:hypothetical protein|nr:hypothetical protein [Streptococcaceae bacterium]
MTKGNFVDIMIFSIFTAFWTLVLHESDIPVQRIAILGIFWLAIDVVLVRILKYVMAERKKSKATKGDAVKLVAYTGGDFF